MRTFQARNRRVSHRQLRSLAHGVPIITTRPVVPLPELVADDDIVFMDAMCNSACP